MEKEEEEEIERAQRSSAQGGAASMCGTRLPRLRDRCDRDLRDKWCRVCSGMDDDLRA
jgi:hypothetical protein